MDDEDMYMMLVMMMLIIGIAIIISIGSHRRASPDMKSQSMAAVVQGHSSRNPKHMNSVCGPNHPSQTIFYC